MMSQQWFIHLDNAPLHIAAVVSSLCDTHDVQRLEHPPYLPNLVPADFFLLKKIKWGLAGHSLYQDSIKNAWEGVARSLIAINLAVAFRSWLERCKKCVHLGSEFIEKSQEINILLSLIVVKLCKDLHLFVFKPRKYAGDSVYPL
jgi:hypothetical protein